jgi:hypothetical protein
VAPETAEGCILRRREMLWRERADGLSARRAVCSQPDVSGKGLEPVRGEVGVGVQPQELGIPFARPSDPMLGRIGSQVGLDDAKAVGRNRFEEVVQSRMRAISSSRRSTLCAVPASRTS